MSDEASPGSGADAVVDNPTLQRFELLYEAGIAKGLGTTMVADHRRILATGIARLRAKIKS